MAKQAMSKSDSTSKTSADSSKTSAQKSSGSKAGVVKPSSDAAENLREFLVDGLKDIFWAEKHLAKALAKMEKNATSQKLKKAIADHQMQTEEQASRLEEVFSILGEKAQAKKCDAMEGLIKEGESIMEETEPGAVRDAAIIAAAQKVEHYEIASYGTMRTYCQLLQEEEAMAILEEILQEEKNCDKLLTKLAVSEINLDAADE